MDPGDDYRPASAARRAAALTVDAAVLLIFTVAVLRRHRDGISDVRRRVVRRRVVAAAIQAGYFTTTTAIAGGSPGQRIWGLRVVDAKTGRRPTWGQAAWRWVIWAGPGIAARVAISVVARRQIDRSTTRHRAPADDEHQALVEISNDPVEPDHELSYRRDIEPTMARIWFPLALAGILAAYRLTVGRRAHDRLSGTRVVARR